MIGKVQDVVAAAVVVGSADQGFGRPSDAQQAGADSAQETGAAAPQTPESVQPADETDTNAQDEKDGKEKDKDKMDEESVSYMAQELNELMSRINANLSFTYHKEVNLLSVQMLDKKTNKVLKEMPPEAMIDHMIKAKDWIGAFLDKNA